MPILHKVCSWIWEFYFSLHNILLAIKFPTSGIRANFKENMAKKVIHRNLFGCFSFLKIGFFLWISKDCKIVPKPGRCSLTCQDLYCKISSCLEVVCYFNYYIVPNCVAVILQQGLLELRTFKDALNKS